MARKNATLPAGDAGKVALRPKKSLHADAYAVIPEALYPCASSNMLKFSAWKRHSRASRPYLDSSIPGLAEYCDAEMRGKVTRTGPGELLRK